MSDSDGIGSPGRQRRSTEKSRENIREYVKLLGRKVQDASPDRKSPSSSDEKSPLRGSPLRGSPSKSPQEADKKESPKVKRALWGGGKGHEKDKEAELPVNKESSALRCERNEKKDEDKEELISRKKNENVNSKVESPKVNPDGTSAVVEKTTKVQKTERRSSSDSKKTPLKVDKTEESSDDSPPDLVLFLKEGRGRTQNWSEPPTLDAESIATRSRTRVPADLNLQFVKKLKPQDNVKAKGKDVVKKEIKKEKSKVLETPESLKRLAQNIPLKEPRRSSSQENESSKTLTGGKGKTKVTPVKDYAISKGKRDEGENSCDEKGKIITRTRLLRKDSNSSLSDTSLGDSSEEKVGLHKKGQHGKKVVAEVGSKAPRENAALRSSLTKGADGDNDQVVPKKNEECNTIVKGMDHCEKRSEHKIKFVVKSPIGMKNKENESSRATSSCEKPVVKVDVEVVGDQGKNFEVDESRKCIKGNVGKGEVLNDAGIKEEASKKSEMRITRSVANPFSDIVEAADNQSRALLPSLPMVGLCNVPLENTQEKQDPVKMSNLVTIAAANPGNGAPVRYRKIHIKIPNLQQSPTNKMESPIFIGNREVVTYKEEVAARISQMSTKEIRVNQLPEEKILSTPEKKLSPNDSNISESDFTLRLSPTPQKVTLYDFSDIEAEEVIVGDGGNSSEPSFPGSCKDPESNVITEQVPHQKQSQEVSLISNEVLDSSSEDDSSKSGEGSSTLKKNLLLSPEGKVALDHCYSSGSSEVSKGSSSKKKSPMSHEKTLSPRPVYSSASLAKRPLDIMMHNDKINILRQMSQIFNNEKPSEEDVESEDDTRSEGRDLGLGVKNKCVSLRGENSKKRMGKSHNRQLLGIKSSASYILTPEKSIVKSPSKVLIVEPSPSYVKDLQKDFNNMSNHKNQDSQKQEGAKEDHVRFHSKQEKNTKGDHVRSHSKQLKDQEDGLTSTHSKQNKGIKGNKEDHSSSQGKQIKDNKDEHVSSHSKQISDDKDLTSSPNKQMKDHKEDRVTQYHSKQTKNKESSVRSLSKKLRNQVTDKKGESRDQVTDKRGESRDQVTDEKGESEVKVVQESILRPLSNKLKAQYTDEKEESEVEVVQESIVRSLSNKLKAQYTDKKEESEVKVVQESIGRSLGNKLKAQYNDKKEKSEVEVVQESSQKEGSKEIHKKLTKDPESSKVACSNAIDNQETLDKVLAVQKPQDSCKKSVKTKVLEDTSGENSMEQDKENLAKETLQQKPQGVNLEESSKEQEETLKESSKVDNLPDEPKSDKGKSNKKEASPKLDINLSSKNSIGKNPCLNKEEKILSVKEVTEHPKADGKATPASSGTSEDEPENTDGNDFPKVFLSPIKGEPFIGFPDKVPKVHHVSSYAASLEENIQIESSIGPKGETIDIIDGFTFISFDTQIEMMEYSKRDSGKAQRSFRRLRKRKGKAKKLSRVKRHGASVQKTSPTSTVVERPRRESQSLPDQSASQSSAFASNDLDAFLDNCSRLNISYPIPKCRATEEGVTKITDDILEYEKKADLPSEHQDIPSSVPDDVDTPQEEQLASAPQNDDAASDTVQQYEEVNAVDILYPKEKYKYYYNKDLCKESKADGSTLFVHRAGKLVPLTSVFKTQKPASSAPVHRKTVELIYIYDGGKLLTLGGSLTKINPSNSDSVRARVVLPMGIPCIPKGQIVDSSQKQVKAVEINEDMAKFALSALQNPFAKESDEKDSALVSSQSSTFPVEKDLVKCESKEKGKSVDKKKAKTLAKIPVKPNKSNILDIIAAKLAMSEDESDEKEEEEEETSKDKECKTERGNMEGACKGEVEEKVPDHKKKEKGIMVLNESSNVKVPKVDAEIIFEVGKGSSRIGETLKVESEVNITDIKRTKLESDSCSEGGKKEKTDIERKMFIKGDVKESKESLVLNKKQQRDREEDKETVCSKDHSEGMKSEADLRDVGIQNKEKEKIVCLEDTSLLPCEGDGPKEEAGPSKSSDGDTNLLVSQNEVSEGIGDRKDEESSSDTTYSGERSVSVLTANKSKVFKKNMYRFPSLSREMKRLSMNFVKYVGETREEQKEPVKIDPNVTCTNEFCKLGCLCETLQCTQRGPEHCGRIECMFECTCRDESWKHPVSESGRTMNAVSIFNVDREQMEGLAVREKDFRRTVIQTGSEVILVGAERRKRERRLPDRYKDSAMLSGNDYVPLDTAESEDAPAIKEEYPSIFLHEASKYIKKCSINIPWYDIKGMSVWCMDHSCYDCKCFTDPSYFAPSEETCLFSLDELSNGDIKPKVEQVKVKEEKKHLVPSCVVVNIDVNNVQSRRRYCWRLKEWYHPVEIHSSRTCGYASSKKRICEETKQLTISGPSSQENSPEQLVENVVRSLRYEKSKEYSQCGFVLPYYDTFGGVSPAKLKKIVELQSKTVVEGVKSESSSESVPVVDLASEVKVEGGSSGLLTKMLKPQSKSDDIHRKRSSSEGKSALSVKKIRLTEPEKVSETTKLSKPDDLSMVGDSAKNLQPSNDRDSTVVSVSDQEEKEFVINKELLKKNNELGGNNEDGSSPRRPLSLVEMMIAEEKRGELELDLSEKTPGVALLVAESRFRKLINMNIIGVIGINKAGRCIISTVDSALCLRTMTRIHTMISNNALDVGPNMREIFFPPAHTAPRQRFVMMRCDSMKKWEIVGVVQKKGSLGYTRKSSEQKSKSFSSQKATSAQPQVIDLEEDEEQDDRQKMNKTDVIEISAQKEISPADELESCIERGTCNWEGSFPQIESVQGASDGQGPEMEVVDNFEIVTSTFGNEVVGETSIPITSVPNLIPLGQLSTDQIATEKPASIDKVPIMPSKSPNMKSPVLLSDSEKTNLEKPNTVSGPVSVAGSQLYFVPTVYSSSTTTVTASFSSSPVTSVSGMRMIKLNQASSKIFGDSSGKSFLPLTPVPPHSSITGAPPLYAASSILPKLTSTTATVSSVSSNPGFENVVVCPASESKRIGLTSVFRPLGPQKSPDAITPVAINPQGFQKPMYFAPNSGVMPRMVLMPPQKGVSPQMVVPQTSKNQRILLMPSTTESGKMVLIPMPPVLGNESAVCGTNEGLGVVGVNTSNQPSSIANKMVIAESSTEQSSNSDVQILSTVKPLPPPPPLRNMAGAGKKETCDDIVILNSPPNNTLTISKVESLSEGKVSCSTSSVQALSTSNSNTKVAVTTMVTSSTTISSTLPLLLPSNNTEASSKNAIDGQLSVKSSSNISVQQETAEKVTAPVPSTSRMSTDNPIIEYETIRSPVKKDKCEEDFKKSPIVKEGKKSDENDGTDDIQEVKVSPPQIKKGGHHWSAVDLSLSFKSVKLEWLLGTIRQNVLVNIYRMSLKTQSPVTLSVKNGTSMSTLYGLARKYYFDPLEQKCLPILILGSVMSAVLSSTSTEDSMLFKANAIKYFIRESTGELASYTYDSSGTRLIKLASKKRAATGEMIGIGETISLHSVRDAKYLGNSRTPDKKKSKIKISQGSDCSCITAGNFICLGHNTATEEKGLVSESAGLPGLPSAVDDKSTGQGSMVVTLLPEDQLKIESNEQNTPSSNSLSEKPSELESTPSIAEDNSCIIESSQVSKNLETAITSQSTSNPDCEIVCVKNSSRAELSAGNSSSSPESLNTNTNRKDQRIVEGEDIIDIEGFCDEESILSNLRVQMVVLNKMMVSGKTVGDFDRPCPLSRKKNQESIPQMRKSSTLFPAKPKEGETRQRVPLQLAQVKLPELHDSHVAGDENHPGPSGVGSSLKQKTNWLGAPVQKLQRREQKIVDIEGLEERSTLVHNELERMRRKALRVLFLNLGSAISLCEKGTSINYYKSHPKVSILKKASETAQSLLQQSLHLNRLEVLHRKERSKLIQRLASAIRDKSEDVKNTWKVWVEQNMKNPLARETFEKTWQPLDMEKEIMALSNESSVDIDTDEGSPLSSPSSPVPGAWTANQQSSPQTSSQPTFAPLRPLKVTALDEHTSLGSTSEEFSSPTSIPKSPATNKQPSTGMRRTSIDKFKADGQSQERKGFPKPPYPYSCITALALKNSKTGTLLVQEIYNFVRSFFPYYRTAPNNWQNALRHCLSTNRCFTKLVVPRGGDRKSHLWKVKEEFAHKLEKDLLKYNVKFLKEIESSMESPHYLIPLMDGDLNIEYSSSADENEDEDTSLATVSIPKSKLKETAEDCSYIKFVLTDGVFVPITSTSMQNMHVGTNRGQGNVFEGNDDPEVIVIE
ncbi:uncharacterized protein [Palaemon carinicauda]|uniref:uncharacterized protein isoform X2 n=1 Tax=Palaemon carinicauda TaxID=392227 RepID=UPI0035B5FBF3